MRQSVKLEATRTGALSFEKRLRERETEREDSFKTQHLFEQIFKMQL